MGKISVKEAILQIKQNSFSPANEIDFRDTKIDVTNAVLLGKNGIDVPEELIEYDDDKIDYSDIPPITDEDFERGKLVNVIPAHINVDAETEDWLKKSNINHNKLLSSLLQNFYKSVKSISVKVQEV